MFGIHPNTHTHSGVVRPLVMTRPPPLVTPKSVGNDSVEATPATDVATPTTTTVECPTLLPPYVAIATQQLNNTVTNQQH